MRVSQERLDQERRMGEARVALHRMAAEHDLSDAEFHAVLAEVLHSLLAGRAYRETPATDEGQPPVHATPGNRDMGGRHQDEGGGRGE